MEESNSAVSEIVATMLLLIIAISATSVIYVNVLSEEGPERTTHYNIVSTIEGLNVILEHQGGDPISLETDISFQIGSSETTFKPKDKKYLDPVDKADGYWDFGERIVFPFTDFRPESCMAGSPALDYREEEIEEPMGGSTEEANFSKIVEEYTGPTNLSSIDLQTQWSSGATIMDLQAIDPENNFISFEGVVDLQHILDFQEWTFGEGVSSITLKFEYVDGKGGHKNTFFHYFDRNSSTRENSGINNKDTSQGYIESKSITINDKESIGFGIESKDGSNFDYWYTNVPLNDNNIRQALVYDLGKTSLGPLGSYMIGFEDLDRVNDPKCDNDFQDLIVIVHVVECN